MHSDTNRRRHLGGLLACASLLACTSSAEDVSGVGGASASASSSSSSTAASTTATSTSSSSASSSSAGGGCPGPELAPGGSSADPGTPGVPFVLASGQDQPIPILVDATYVYFGTTLGTGSVRRVPTSGGPVEILAKLNPWYLAQDADHLYFGDDTTVYSMPKSGGCLTTLAIGQDLPTHIAVDATHVYWVARNDGAVRRVPIGGGSVEDLATGQNQPFSIALDDTHVYWTNNAGNVTGEASVNRAPKGGGVAELLVPGRSLAWDIALAGDRVYWHEPGGDTAGVYSTPKAGGAAQLHGSVEGTYTFTLDGGEAFVTGPVLGGVRAISLGDGTIREIALEHANGVDIQTDASHVYWTNYDDNEIIRAPK